MPITAYPRRDTEEKWNEHNPIPRENEVCVVYTEWGGVMYKKGNGSSSYSELPFLPLEEVLENGIMYFNGISIKIRGLFNEKAGEEIDEQVYCPREFVW